MMHISATPNYPRWAIDGVGASGLVPFGNNLQNFLTSAFQQTNDGVRCGCNMLRFNIFWRDVELSVGNYSLSGNATITTTMAGLDECVAQGVQPMIVLLSAQTLYPDANIFNGGATEIAAFGEFTRYVFTQLLGKVHHYELLNEPEGQGGYSAAAYRLLMMTVYPILKGIDPTALLGCGVGTGPTQSGALLNLADVSPWMDAVSFHNYGTPTNFAGDSPEYFWQQAIKGINVINNTLAFSNPSGPFRPCWISESGYLSNMVVPSGDAEVAKRLSRHLAMMRSTKLIAYVQYSLYDAGGAGVSAWGWVPSVGGALRASGQMAHDCLAHITLAIGATRYRPEYAKDRTILLGGPWAVKLTISPTDERLFIWSTVPSDRVDINAHAAAGTTLNIQTPGSGGSTATQTLVAGDNLVPLTLSDTSLILYGTGVTFPQFTD